MTKKLLSLLSLLALLNGVLVGCGMTPVPTETPEPTQAPEATVALKITGNVEKEIGWTEEEVRAMPTTDAQSTNKQGQTETYTGVPIKDLLALAGPARGATTLVLVGDDGYTAEVALADVQSCADCIVSFREKGGFSTVLPSFPGQVQIKGVVAIQVK